jgi:RPA family protein
VKFEDIKGTNDNGYVPFVVITNRSVPYSRFITGFVTRVTQRNTTSVTIGAGIADSFGALEVTSGF